MPTAAPRCLPAPRIPEQLAPPDRRQRAPNPRNDLREASGISALLIISSEQPNTGWSLDPNVIFPTHPPLNERLDRLAETTRRLGRRLPASPQRRSPTIAPRSERNIGASVVLLAGVATTALSWLPTSPAFASRDWTYALIALSAPALLIGFRAIGPAHAGASGLTYATMGVALLLVLPFSYLLGFVSYLFAGAMNWA